LSFIHTFPQIERLEIFEREEKRRIEEKRKNPFKKKVKRKLGFIGEGEDS
jgi:hypothetical protein